MSSPFSWGESPPLCSPTSDIGTNSFGRQPRAVIIGRAFSQEDVEALRDACKGINKDPVAWIVGNPAKKPPAGAPSRLPEYAAAVARDCKDTLTKWVERGASKEELLLF
ncbi:hypothetical protein N7468_006810 [Penicillium chermesinum]|uniref:Uncharacterized protein n=1 Tax=Penicillium chermesinum TaxID=63820 RepID=A0A9W9NSW3_9EURO|nr:uncharacterized protein N7468_006810 [Penicillium chermesinum]KAJ5225585.1 hypothetical protein N7468_006810 [Penicillium chermesinum]